MRRGAAWACALVCLAGAGPALGQTLAIEPVGNSVPVRRFAVADLDADGGDEVITVAGNNAYVYVWSHEQLSQLSQISFEMSRAPFLSGVSEARGERGAEFALSQLDSSTLRVVVYGASQATVVPRDTLLVERSAVGGIVTEEGSYPWDAYVTFLGRLPGTGPEGTLLFAACAGESSQPRGLMAFRAESPHAIAWMRLVGPCTEPPYPVVWGATPAETRVVLAGSGYGNGAIGSNVPSLTSAILVVDGTGELLWWREVGPPHSAVRHAVADLDGDRMVEIVVASRNQDKNAGDLPVLRVLSLDGRQLGERVMEANVGGITIMGPGRDGRRQILVLCEDGWVRRFDSELRPTGAIKTRPTLPPILLVDDLCNDGRDEIVVRSPKGEDLDVYDRRLHLAGQLATGGTAPADVRTMHLADGRRLLAVRVGDELRLVRIRRLPLGARLLNGLRGALSRHLLPAFGLVLALTVAVGLVARESRRRPSGEGARERLRSLVADLKIVRHGVRAEGEKPEPIVRLLRGLRTCTEPADFAAGIAILRDTATTYRSYVAPTLQRIVRTSRLVLPRGPALALSVAAHRATADLDHLFEQLRGREPEASRIGPLCVRAERSVTALEQRLREIEAAALARVPADPFAEVSAACEALRPVIKERGVAFEGIEVTGEPGARAFVEPPLLRRVIHDLLLNAIEACQDAAEPRVAVAIACGERRLSVLIRDNGRGVAAADAEAIFHGRSTKTPPGGSGLVHARRVIESYSGTVLLRESTPWEATIFEVTLCRVPF